MVGIVRNTVVRISSAIRSSLLITKTVRMCSACTSYATAPIWFGPLPVRHSTDPGLTESVGVVMVLRCALLPSLWHWS